MLKNTLVLTACALMMAAAPVMAHPDHGGDNGGTCPGGGIVAIEGGSCPGGGNGGGNGGGSCPGGH